MKQNAIDIVKKFMPYSYSIGNSLSEVEATRFWNAVECARIFIANVKIFCPYVNRKDRETVRELRSPDYQFVDYWIEIEGELNQLTLEYVKWSTITTDDCLNFKNS